MSSSSSSSSAPSKPSKAPAQNRSNKPKKNKKSKKIKGARSVTQNLPSRVLAQSYVDSVNDPFENQGCKLGWGCLVPSTLATGYWKGAYASNADGTLALCLLPNATGALRIANGGQAVSFATAALTQSLLDATPLDANYSSARVISGGIRAYPSIPLTSAPGAVYAGAIPSLTFTQSQAFTPAGLASSPYMKQFRSYEGATSTLRPIDTFSFEFDTRNVSATVVWSGNSDIPVSIPYMCFVGLPAATPVFIEAVINYECIAKSVTDTASLAFGDKQQSDLMASYFPSMETMWNTVKPYLAAAGRYGAQSALAAATSSIYNGGSKAEQLKFPGKAFRL